MPSCPKSFGEAAPQPLIRLDLRRKDLLVQKEELLKQSKIKLATVESVKLQIDTLMKVTPFFHHSVRSHPSPPGFSGRRRHSEKSRRAGPTISFVTRGHDPGPHLAGRVATSNA